MKKVPVITRKLSDKEALFFSLVENIQRADLNPLEQARGLERLINDLQLTHEKAGDSVGLSRPAVSNLLRLLSLAEAVQKCWKTDAWRWDMHGRCGACQTRAGGGG